MGGVTVLDRFTPATRDWFSGAFGEPTAAQAGAWDAVAEGEHAGDVPEPGGPRGVQVDLGDHGEQRVHLRHATDPGRLVDGVVSRRPPRLPGPRPPGIRAAARLSLPSDGCA